METEYLGRKERKVGIEVIDENDSMHTVEVGLDGEIIFHGNDDYPQKREDRTDEEQRIMSQVEARAAYAAHQEFPDEDILPLNWDPEHYEAAIAAFNRYPLEEFLADFRPFYHALRDPTQLVDDPQLDPDTTTCSVVVHFDDTVRDVSEVLVEYSRHDGSTHLVGEVSDYPGKEVVLTMPRLEFDPEFDYEDQFPDVIVGHLMAQIRDIYLNMGESPPEEYRVEGIGKLDIHADR